MSQDIYKIAFEKWLLEFQSKFNKNERSSDLEIFVLNKDFFHSQKKEEVLIAKFFIMIFLTIKMEMFVY